MSGTRRVRQTKHSGKENQLANTTNFAVLTTVIEQPFGGGGASCQTVKLFFLFPMMTIPTGTMATRQERQQLRRASPSLLTVLRSNLRYGTTATAAASWRVLELLNLLVTTDRENSILKRGSGASAYLPPPGLSRGRGLSSLSPPPR